MLTLLSILGFSVGTCSDIVIPTRYDFFTMTRFPVQFRIRDWDGYIHGFVSLDLRSEMSAFTTDNMEEIDVSFTSVNAVIFGNFSSPNSAQNFHILDYFTMLPFSFNHPANPTVHISADLESPLLRSVGDYLLTPTSNSEGLVVLNPSNPSQYAYGSEIFYTPVTRLDSLEFSAIIQVGASNQTFEAECVINTGAHEYDDFLRIPDPVFEEFSRQLEATGISANTLSFIDEPGSLPSINFLIRVHDGSFVSIQSVSSDDYLRPRDDNQDLLDILVMPSDSSTFCDFGKFLIRKIVLHVDGTNRRIGFGEPLNEI